MALVLAPAVLAALSSPGGLTVLAAVGKFTASVAAGLTITGIMFGG